ncbi:MAG: 16S rRNA (guanine(966)-N(2))-methyltransferase RsmD [Planctomycetes bacterium]|nr:16S rRNA (guanine(966)-N(2))-methyltransferase RsmD [Planctomycetota bacterium]MBM4078103.1 16S rRNA (guanine(966)-N(2))-methyltransferase RsmD [Planctomycetota bacterium]MBM4083264.1 16S rRNA (guanine(966)-N(2))-methyltransferase RsmD [Planctomycetota bacterium]
MRIIAGQAKGRQLHRVKSDRTRPASNKVKAALFNILGEFVERQRVLDLFAGTGSLGIEALSRGAAHCTFVDNSRTCLRVIEQNLQVTGLRDRADLWRADVFRLQNRLTTTGTRVGLVLVAPPYDLVEKPVTRDRLMELFIFMATHGILARDGFISLEHRHRTFAPERLEGLTVHDVRRYGETEITLLRTARME